MRAKFNTRSNREIRQIAEYYHVEAGAPFAQEFLEDLSKTVDRIKIWPRSFPIIRNDLRKATLRKYPFVLIYRIESEDLLRILSVRHHKQNPDHGLAS